MIKKEKVLITPYNEKRRLHIYLPACVKKGQRCGVIYMFDGHNLFNDKDATYGKSWGLKKYLDEKRLPVIVVGLECNHKGNLRLCEFSPYNFNDKELGKVTASGKELTRWIVDELKPYIDSKYPTIPDREHTAIGGSSMGGLMALFIGATESETFSKAICVSPHHKHMMKPLMRDVSGPVHPDTFFYISWGANEVRTKQALATLSEANLRLAGALRGRADVSCHLYPNQDHSEASWEKETPIWIKESGIMNWEAK
ncbi:MAG: alpha/beta hydrolase [Erysipelotrichaceae bacterium]|nr:alpha/beta hydrolase [Erysipelotrichaceae bacterium]